VEAAGEDIVIKGRGESLSLGEECEENWDGEKSKTRSKSHVKYPLTTLNPETPSYAQPSNPQP